MTHKRYSNGYEGDYNLPLYLQLQSLALKYKALYENNKNSDIALLYIENMGKISVYMHQVMCNHLTESGELSVIKYVKGRI